MNSQIIDTHETWLEEEYGDVISLLKEWGGNISEDISHDRLLQKKDFLLRQICS